MESKLYFYYNKPADKTDLNRKSDSTQKSLSDFTVGDYKREKSKLGINVKEIYSNLFNYSSQNTADAQEIVNFKEFLITAAEVLKKGQGIEHFSSDEDYTEYCKNYHFENANLSGLYSGVKFRGRYDEMLSAYDDIINLSNKYSLHMLSVGCFKDDDVFIEIQMEYSDYLVNKDEFVYITKQYPALRMVAISVPTERWNDWFFFTSGSYSDKIRSERIRYERTAEPEYYWSKSHYFTDYDWFACDFNYFELGVWFRAYPSQFNWSKTLEYPTEYQGREITFCCVSRNKFAEKIILPATIKKIMPYSFCNCSCLKEIVVPSVVKIHSNAFINCKKLKSLTATEKLKDIASDAFVDCPNLEL